MLRRNVRGCTLIVPCGEGFAHFGSARYKKQMAQKQIVPLESVANRIFIIRGHRVMLDSDPAELYPVETRALVQGVKRNSERFPAEFMLQLSAEEFEHWRSQIVMSSPGARAAHHFAALAAARSFSRLSMRLLMAVSLPCNAPTLKKARSSTGASS